MYLALKGCKVCMDGIRCEEHKYVKKHEFIEKKKVEPPTINNRK